MGALLPVEAAGPGAMPEVVGDRDATTVVVTLRDADGVDSGADAAAVREHVRTTARRLGITPDQVFASIGPVFSAAVTAPQRAALERDREVLSVESDDPVVDQET